MKKKIMLLAAALMLFMGVVNASSINGDYKGNPIVKVMSNGKLLQSDEVPAMIYDGHTVVPISLLRQIGASVEWNQDTYSVDVKMPQTAAQNGSVNLPQLRLDLIDVVSATDYSIDQNGISKLTFSLLFNSGSGADDKYNRVMNTGAATGVDRLTLIDEKQDGYIHSYRTADMKDLINNKISVDEFKSKIDTQPKIQQTSSVPIQQNQSNPLPQQIQPQNNNAQVISQYNLLSDFNIYLQNSLDSIIGFVNTTDSYYAQWNSGNSAAPTPQYLEGETRRIIGIANEINTRGNQVYSQLNGINVDKTNGLIKEIYDLNGDISKSYESIYGWKVSNYDLENDSYGANKQVAGQYLNEYKAYSTNLIKKANQIKEKLKIEYENQKNIVNSLR